MIATTFRFCQQMSHVEVGECDGRRARRTITGPILATLHEPHLAPLLVEKGFRHEVGLLIIGCARLANPLPLGAPWPQGAPWAPLHRGARGARPGAGPTEAHLHSLHSHSPHYYWLANALGTVLTATIANWQLLLCGNFLFRVDFKDGNYC